MKPIITAIMVDEKVREYLIDRCKERNVHQEQEGTWHCHHVTMAYNVPWNGKLNVERPIMLTHIGRTDSGVVAFKVLGAEDSLNKVPHLTVFTPKGTRPVESNNITQWERWNDNFHQFLGFLTQYSP